MSSQAPERAFSNTGVGTPLAACARRPAPPAGPYLVLGLGRAGRAAARALAERFGADSVRAWDDARAPAVRRAMRARGALLGRHERATALEGVRTVVKSPGIPFTHPLLVCARERGLAILDELELGWRMSTQPMIAVTGTNGKSTTTALIGAVMAASGCAPALVGNVESDLGVPLSAVPDCRSGWVLAEVSSYQACGLVELMADAAVLTNLTPDHLHWHRSMEAYGRAKRRLFVHRERAVALAVLNADDPFGQRLVRDVRACGGRAVTFGGRADADYRISACHSRAGGSLLALDTPGGPIELRTRLRGEHNAFNLAAALALADALGLARAPTLAALADADAPAGRMESLDAGQPYDVFVDFAHSPDGLDRVLATLRAIAAPRHARVIAVVGLAPAGDRDTRVSCGRAARAGCNHLILSGWSSKGEPPLLALAGMLAGARQTRGARLEVVLDRRKAIARGLSLARAGDVVAVLGRGQSRHLRVDAHSPPVPFDDRAVVRELLARRY